MTKIAGLKIHKTATGKIKEVVINYKKFSQYVDDFIDGQRAVQILEEDKERFSMADVFASEYKRRGIKK